MRKTEDFPYSNCPGAQRKNGGISCGGRRVGNYNEHPKLLSKFTYGRT